MGMFDEIKCKMPMPDGVELDVDHRDHWFQTKSLRCAMDYYEIREDGTLWAQPYETEDRSDPDKEGFAGLVGCMARVNQRWEQVKEFTGEIVFYTRASSIGQPIDSGGHSGWIEFSVYFVGGKLKHFELLEFREPASC